MRHMVVLFAWHKPWLLQVIGSYLGRQDFASARLACKCWSVHITEGTCRNSRKHNLIIQELLKGLRCRAPFTSTDFKPVLAFSALFL